MGWLGQEGFEPEIELTPAQSNLVSNFRFVDIYISGASSPGPGASKSTVALLPEKGTKPAKKKQKIHKVGLGKWDWHRAGAAAIGAALEQSSHGFVTNL